MSTRTCRFAYAYLTAAFHTQENTDTHYHTHRLVGEDAHRQRLKAIVVQMSELSSDRILIGIKLSQAWRERAFSSAWVHLLLCSYIGIAIMCIFFALFWCLVSCYDGRVFCFVSRFVDKSVSVFLPLLFLWFFHSHILQTHTHTFNYRDQYNWNFTIFNMCNFEFDVQFIVI